MTIPAADCNSKATRPIVIITSNNEKELPDAFLRRCFFHSIKMSAHPPTLREG